MSAVELLERLRLAGVDLWADGERLRYDAPAEALTDELLERMRAHKPEILELVRAATARSLPARIPLSPAQEGFWLLNSLYPGHAGGNEQFAIRLEGPLDRSALDRAWRCVVARHDILRARFGDEVGVPWQRIADEPPALPGYLDLAAAGGDLRAVATRALSTPFDLGREALVRALLVRLGTDSHLLLVTVHHIVADGRSVPVIRDDLAGFYEQLRSGREPDAGAGVPQYAGFAIRQRADPDTPRHARHLDWWRRHLEGAPARHALPRRARSSSAGGEARRHSYAIDAGTATRLRALAREQGVTFFTLLLCAFRVLLARYSGQDDIVISSPVTFRDDPLTRRMVGCLINNVVFRTMTAGDPAFTELLARERSTVLGVLEHRRVPFGRVIEALDLPRQAGEQPLSQVIFQFDAAPAARRAADVAFTVAPVEADRQSYWDLEWSLTDHGDGQGLTGQVCWSTAVFEDWLAEAMPRHFATLLDGIAAQPHGPLSELPLLGPADRHRVLVEWNATAADYPSAATLHKLVYAQCDRSPDAVALRNDAGTVAYGELARRASVLAARLAALGAAPGERVALLLRPSAGLVVGLLAILRTGAAVVPLDPAYPRARLGFMLRDSGARVLVTERGADEGLDAANAARVDLDDIDWLAPGLDPAAAVTPDSPACVLYTSGSTGEPKGAIGLHRGAVNRCHWMWRAHGFGAHDVFCLRTSINFVDSLWEIFGALMHGIPLVILPDETARDPALLVPALARHGVTQLVLVPPLLRALLEFAPDLGARLPLLRHVITSGEPLPPELLAAARRTLPAASLLNTYGTSEIWDATCCDTSVLDAAMDRVPIGRPIANVRSYVLDRGLRPVPVGVPGELCVGGTAFGAGYWQRPELTAERFVADPFTGAPGAKLYRTGDLARYLPDGTIECLGRVDRQLKLRGYRVEPGEIEAMLRGCDGVTDAAVVLREDVGEPGLVAYVVSAQAEVDIAALKGEAGRRLPRYMQPCAWVPLERLPLTPSGKIDRDALPPPAGPALRGAPRAPADQTEARLIGLWAAVLSKTSPGPEDSFFDLGGQSLLAMRLLARATAEFGVTLTLRDLFEAPTVAGMAQRIRARPATAEPALLPLGRDAPLPLSWGQERLWFLDQLDPASPAYNIAWTIAVRGALDVGRLQQALDRVVARHESLRTVFPGEGGRPVQVIHAELRIPIELEPVSHESVAARRDALARRPFDLGAGPLLRVALLRLGEREHELVIVVHHIITDGTSNGILFDELAAWYDALISGTSPSLAALPVQYADFAFWQRRWLSGERSRRQLDYWTSRLRGAPPALELPTDFPRPAEQKFRGAWVWRSVAAGRASALRDFARRHDATPYMLLLAAFKLLLARYSGEHDLLVGTPVSARPHADLDGLVGLFINTIVLRTETCGDPSFGEFLGRVRATVVDAFANQDVPFERLVESLKPDRTLARAPVFQVMFNLVPIPARSRSAGGAEFRLGRLLDHGVSTFDLTLTVGEHAEGLELIFEFDTDLFRQETVERMADAYGVLIDSVLRDPGATISRVPLLAPAGIDELRARLTGSRAASAAPETVLSLLDARMALRGDAEAVAGAGQRLSYAGLAARANRIAHLLRRRGCGPGHRVGLCLPRSTDLVAATIGVLKSGAAYVPLDPDYPAARLRFMAEDARLTLVVTAGDAAGAAIGPGVPVLDLDAEAWRLGQQPAAPPAVEVSPSDAAYVIYTSGTTGEAKGVVVSHANLAATFRGWETAYGLRAGDVHLQMASAAFDVFTGDWVRALLSGARLLLCPREALLDPARLHELMTREQVTVAEFVPAAIRPLMAWLQRKSANLAFMRLLIVGSDAWHGGEYRALRALCGPQARVVNSYGVAEATIDSTWFEGDDPGGGTVPIGVPFPQVAIRILDEHLQPVPVGVPGELCIGGAGVAQGYWQRPALTVERFVVDAGERLYRTGDRARLRSDGVIEFLGRLDTQVKVRGFRIELGEVQSVLGAVAGVESCAVGVREAGPGDARLVAWVVVRTGAEVSVAALRAALKRQLPDYMLPAAFVMLAALPLTPNGKLDRAALPAPAWGSGPGEGYVAPRSAVEEALCGLFGEVLGSAGAVGIFDDFFALGGHSLLATQLVSRIRDSLAVEVPLRILFESPTVAALGEVVVAARLSA